MEGKVTTYLFYTGILFSLITMILCMIVFQNNSDEQMVKTLKLYCDTAVANTENEEEISKYLPSFTDFSVIQKDKTVKAGQKNEYTDGEKLLNDKNLKSLNEKKSAGGIIKTDSFKTDLAYAIVPFSDNDYLCVYAETKTFANTANQTFPFLFVIFFAVVIVSGASAIILTDLFMKPVKKITSDDFVFNMTEDNSEIYEELIPILNVKSKAEKMKRQFTANVSHELKTPLTSISGYAQLIESGIAAGDDIVKFASVINKESQRMLYLVGDILKLSELEEENTNIIKEDADLFEISKSAIDSLEVVAKKNGISMTLLGDSTVIRGNKNLIYELIYNLCDNAIRYNKPGGSVTVETKNRAVIVSDTGIGIDKKYHNRIFERFYRVDKSRSKQTGGTGLGLSIVKHIAELHGGKITITSELGSGTQIKVSF